METLLIAAFMLFAVVSWLRGLAAPISASARRMADEEEHDAIAYRQQQIDRDRFGEWN